MGRNYKNGEKGKRNQHLQYEAGSYEHKRSAYLRHAYGITLEDYNSMFTKQEGKCAICKIHQIELNKSLCVDHCHSTGKIRGLLCHNCNHAIGKLQDSPMIIMAAYNYLVENQR